MIAVILCFEFTLINNPVVFAVLILLARSRVPSKHIEHSLSIFANIRTNYLFSEQGYTKVTKCKFIFTLPLSIT